MTLSLTGKQIRDVLEQQWSGANANSPRILQPSKELSYQYAANTSVSPRATNIMIAGSPLVDTKVYRVTVNSFLADGGDNFTVLKKAKTVSVVVKILMRLKTMLLKTLKIHL